MEDNKCIFCKKENDQIVIEENGYRGIKCSNCGLIYVSPRDSFSKIQNLYTNASISAERQINSSFKKRICARHHLKIIKKFVKNGSMLEIGAGAGYFLDESKKEGFEVYGTEFNNIKAEFIRNKLGIPCEETPLHEHTFNGKKFNVVYHCDVISHFYDPIAEFNKINNILKDEGILVFETGNIPEVSDKYFKSIKKFNYPEHLFFFGENNLKELLNKTGYDFIKIYRYSILPQKYFFSLLGKITKFIKPGQKIKRKDRNESEKKFEKKDNSFNIKIILKNIYSYLFYFLRYKIGYIAIKKGRQQTLIVVARKKNVNYH